MRRALDERDVLHPLSNGPRHRKSYARTRAGRDARGHSGGRQRVAPMVGDTPRHDIRRVGGRTQERGSCADEADIRRSASGSRLLRMGRQQVEEPRRDDVPPSLHAEAAGQQLDAGQHQDRRRAHRCRPHASGGPCRGRARSQRRPVGIGPTLTRGMLGALAAGRTTERRCDGGPSLRTFG